MCASANRSSRSTFSAAHAALLKTVRTRYGPRCEELAYDETATATCNGMLTGILGPWAPHGSGAPQTLRDVCPVACAAATGAAPSCGSAAVVRPGLVAVPEAEAPKLLASKFGSAWMDGGAK